MLLELVNAPGIDSLAFEDAGGVVQAVREHMGFRFAPGHELAVIPDGTVAIVEGNHVGHHVSGSFGPCPPERRKPIYVSTLTLTAASGPTPYYTVAKPGPSKVSRAARGRGTDMQRRRGSRRNRRPARTEGSRRG